MRELPPYLRVVGDGESQGAGGAPWTGTVDPAGGAIPSGSTWAPVTGASVEVALTKLSQGVAPILKAGSNFLRNLLIAVGAIAVGGAAFWAYREYGHKLFGKGRKGGGARKRPRRRGRSKRG